MLKEAGVEHVYNMEGGIRAWEGFVAEGTPDSGAAHFPEGASREELVWLARQLEDGSRRFYHSLAETVIDSALKDLLERLEQAEEHHKKTLENLLADSAANPFGDQSDIMEGGMQISRALSWSTGKRLADILELLLSLETNAYDLYLRMIRRFSGERSSSEVFAALAEEEKQHLNRLSLLLDENL